MLTVKALRLINYLSIRPYLSYRTVLWEEATSKGTKCWYRQ